MSREACALFEVGMFSRCCAAFGTLMLMSYATASLSDAGVALSFQDWNGNVLQTTLPDKSILTEYVASTRSANTDGAELQLSFIPRFGCTPQISILLPVGVVDESAGLDGFVISIDQEAQEFPVLAGADESVVRYSMNADSASHQELRQKLDFASTLKVFWPSIALAAGGTALANETNSEASVDSSNAEPADYSLLGSRATVKAVEDQCNSHEPIPYNI